MLKSNPEFELGITLFTKATWEFVEKDIIFINEIDQYF